MRSLIKKILLEGDLSWMEDINPLQGVPERCYLIFHPPLDYEKEKDLFDKVKVLFDELDFKYTGSGENPIDVALTPLIYDANNSRFLYSFTKIGDDIIGYYVAKTRHRWDRWFNSRQPYMRDLTRINVRDFL